MCRVCIPFHHRVAMMACYLTGASHGSRTHHLVRTKDACSHAYSASNSLSPTGTRTRTRPGQLASALPRCFVPFRAQLFRPGAYAIPPPGFTSRVNRLLVESTAGFEPANTRVAAGALRPLGYVDVMCSFRCCCCSCCLCRRRVPCRNWVREVTDQDRLPTACHQHHLLSLDLSAA